MRIIKYDESVSRPLPFYLAMEEYFARHFSDESFFFMWQVEPTVIIGRHQLLEAEINRQYCVARGINVVRRKSGGGAVYADRNNIMFSYITSSGDVSDTFEAYTRRVAEMLTQLGLEAEATHRNDVLVAGRKISGNAYYHLAGRSIVHGTMLYDADLDTMTAALTPSALKLQSKGITSVRSRVTTILEHRPDISLGTFKEYVSEFMTDVAPYLLTSDDIKQIELMARDYSSPAWLQGRNPAGTLKNTCRYEGVGEVTATLECRHGKIADVTLSGDFFAPESLNELINKALSDVAYTPEAVSGALNNFSSDCLIKGLTHKQLIDLLF